MYVHSSPAFMLRKTVLEKQAFQLFIKSKHVLYSEIPYKTTDLISTPWYIAMSAAAYLFRFTVFINIVAALSDTGDSACACCDEFQQYRLETTQLLRQVWI
jgi:hypothetical protein